jgi:hypothetical protein
LAIHLQSMVKKFKPTAADRCALRAESTTATRRK